MVCLTFAATKSAHACCAVAAGGVPVVNADQTVIIWWDKSNQIKHFIRKASFRGGGESIGFLVPTPSRPQLEESGDEAFRYLANITAPKRFAGGGFPLGCSVAAPSNSIQGVRLIEEKTVTGFDAVVLAADSGKAPGDVTFTPSADQGKLTRDLSAVGKSFDPTLLALIGVFLARPLFRRRKIRHPEVR